MQIHFTDNRAVKTGVFDGDHDAVVSVEGRIEQNRTFLDLAIAEIDRFDHALAVDTYGLYPPGRRALVHGDVEMIEVARQQVVEAVDDTAVRVPTIGFVGFSATLRAGVRLTLINKAVTDFGGVGEIGCGSAI